MQKKSNLEGATTNSSHAKKESHDYEVGYGKPPKQTRFKRGQSGNPRGRPKRSKNLATTLSKTLDETIVIRSKHGTKKITKREALVQKTVHDALSGDLRALKAVMDMLKLAGLDTEFVQELKAASQKQLSDADEAILNRYFNTGGGNP